MVENYKLLTALRSTNNRIMETKDLIVVKKVNNEDEEFFITREKNFEKQKLCDCFDNFGQKIGCYNAGCYSLDNSSSDVYKDCLKELYKNFGVEYTDDNLQYSDFDDAASGDNELLYNVPQSSIDDFISEWKERNENHIEVKAWTYWDGHNFKTFVLEADSGMVDVEELGLEKQESILSEYPGVPYIEGTLESDETENYVFTFTRWADDPWICSVKERE